MSKLKITLILILLGLIIVVGLKYRFRSYQSYPPIGENFDEQVLVWAGSSLINNRVPTSWSFIDDYTSDNRGHLVKVDGWGISIDGRKPNLANFSFFPKPLSHKTELNLDGYKSHFTLVQPQIEQPPLGPLMASFLSGSFKKSSFDQVSLKEIRIPVIYLSVVSIIIIFLIAYFSYGILTGLFSALIYALMPINVISQRMATAENYLTPFILLGVLFTQLWIKREKKIFLLLASFLITICYLIKPFGIFLGGVVFLAIIVYGKPKKNLLFPAVFSLLGIGSFYSYGNFYAPNLFPKIVVYQMNRLYSPLEGIFKIIIPKITKVFLDGWVIFGWFSIACLTFRHQIKKDFWVIIPILSYLLILTLYGGQDYGWYRMPIYPFLSIATAVVLYQAIYNFQVLMGVIFLLTAFVTSLWWAFFSLDWTQVVLLFRLFMVGFLLLLSLGFLNSPKAKMVSAFTLIILIVLTFWLNIKTINNMPIIWSSLREATIVWSKGK